MLMRLGLIPEWRSIMRGHRTMVMQGKQAFAAVPQWREQQDTQGSLTRKDARLDEQAFEAFFQRHQRDTFQFLWHLTGDEQAAHDLAQETFLRAWQQFAKVSAYEKPQAWLFRVATNLAIDHQRRHSISTRATSPLDESLAVSDPTLRVVQRLDDDVAIRAAMLGLPARQRSALILRVIYELSGEEIAATLGISNVAARMALSRARAQFRKSYTRHEKGR